MFLFVQQWEIARGKGAEYTDFVLRKHLPISAKIGFNMIGGFHVMVGSGPRISAVALADDSVQLQKAIESEEFLALTKELQEFVYGYTNAILRSTGRVDTKGYGIEVGAWRFNQYYKLIYGTEAKYAEFLKNRYIPEIEKLGIRIKAEWQVLLGTGLRLLLEGVTTNLVDVAQVIISDKFRNLRRELLSNFAANYSSRILAPTGRVEIAYLLGEMTKSL